MYPIGCNAINDRTIGESAQGLADYVKSQVEGGQLACAIAYDTRHNSRHFAELCAGIMVAAGFRVYFLDDYRSTPELSFLVRYRQCSCGIMVTASHNPPSDNAVKVYWSTGGQVLPPHDEAIIDRVMHVEDIRRVPFAEAVRDGRIVLCRAEVDAAFLAGTQVAAFGRPARRPGPLLAAARSGRFRRLSGPGRGRICRGRGLWPARGTQRRLSQRAGPRLQPGKPGRVRRDHRAGAGHRRGSDPGHRPGLRPHGLRGPADFGQIRRSGGRSPAINWGPC